MKKITGNESMTPIIIPGFVYGDGSHEEPSVKGGLTIRQHFAAMAMQGVLANTDIVQIFKGNNVVPVTKQIVTVSLLMADALITELNKTP